MENQPDLCKFVANCFQFEYITPHLSDLASASRFKVQKENKVTCSHEEYQVLRQRVEDGKGRAVGKEIYVYGHPGREGEEL